ncbi:MAG: hypothetical protein JW786_00600 [Desulfobacterales bacterium]|nr:hypothetical protein [Desulfobacterales bacterium]
MRAIKLIKIIILFVVLVFGISSMGFSLEDGDITYFEITDGKTQFHLGAALLRHAL